MPSRETLAQFLRSALVPHSRDRFVGFVSHRKTQGKFLEAVYHDLLGRFDRRFIVAGLPASAWSAPAFSYSQRGGFGGEQPSLRAAHQELTDAVLVVTQDSRFGFFREEGRLDSEILIDITRVVNDG